MCDPVRVGGVRGRVPLGAQTYGDPTPRTEDPLFGDSDVPTGVAVLKGNSGTGGVSEVKGGMYGRPGKITIRVYGLTKLNDSDVLNKEFLCLIFVF